MIIFSCIHVAVNDILSFFLLLSFIPLYLCIKSSLFIHLSWYKRSRCPGSVSGCEGTVCKEPVRNEQDLPMETVSAASGTPLALTGLPGEKFRLGQHFPKCNGC